MGPQVAPGQGRGMFAYAQPQNPAMARQAGLAPWLRQASATQSQAPVAAPPATSIPPWWQGIQQQQEAARAKEVAAYQMKQAEILRQQEAEKARLAAEKAETLVLDSWERE